MSRPEKEILVQLANNVLCYPFSLIRVESQKYMIFRLGEFMIDSL